MRSSVDDFLAICSPEVRDLAQQLRGLVRRVMPTAVEQVDLPSKYRRLRVKPYAHTKPSLARMRRIAVPSTAAVLVDSVNLEGAG